MENESGNQLQLKELYMETTLISWHIDHMQTRTLGWTTLMTTKNLVPSKTFQF